MCVGMLRLMNDVSLGLQLMRVLADYNKVDVTHQLCSQASEGMWGMPGHTEARKAVVSCDKPGGVAHTQ